MVACRFPNARRRTIPGLITLSAAFAACGESTADRAPAAEPVIRIESESEYEALTQITLEEVGPVCTTPVEACGTSVSGSVALRADGAVAFATLGRQPQVYLVEAPAAPARAVGRAGGGPGEYRGPWNVAFTSSGGVEVLDWLQRRVVRFAADGTPTGSHVIPLPPGFITTGHVGDSLRVIATDNARAKGDSASVVLFAIDSGSTRPELTTTLPLRARAWDIADMRPASGLFAPNTQWVIASDGRTLHSDADRLLVDIYDADGRHVQRFGFDVTPRRVTDAEFTRERELRLSRIGNAEIRAGLERQMGTAPARHAAITRIVALPGGETWVRESPNEAHDAVPWIVFDPSGTARGRVELGPEEIIVGAHDGRLMLSTEAGLVWMRER
jgi:hypothetical protein